MRPLFNVLSLPRLTSISRGFRSPPISMFPPRLTFLKLLFIILPRECPPLPPRHPQPPLPEARTSRSAAIFFCEAPLAWVVSLQDSRSPAPPRRLESIPSWYIVPPPSRPLSPLTSPLHFLPPFGRRVQPGSSLSQCPHRFLKAGHLQFSRKSPTSFLLRPRSDHWLQKRSPCCICFPSVARQEATPVWWRPSKIDF